MAQQKYDLVQPIKLPRYKIEDFLRCSRCFYLDMKYGIQHPFGPSFSLNLAVDQLLKNEFNILRKRQEPHELMKKYGIDAVPYNNTELFDKWTNNRFGIQFLHKDTNFLVTGVPDDIWVNPKGEFYIVDYKSTSTTKPISLEDEYKQGYKKQVEIYQWIFRKNDFKVSDTAYFVFANAIKEGDMFDGKLEFEMSIIEHKGDDSWVEPTLFDIQKCLASDTPPVSSPDCEYCNYVKMVGLSAFKYKPRKNRKK